MIHPSLKLRPTSYELRIASHKMVLFTCFRVVAKWTVHSGTAHSDYCRRLFPSPLKTFIFVCSLNNPFICSFISRISFVNGIFVSLFSIIIFNDLILSSKCVGGYWYDTSNEGMSLNFWMSLNPLYNFIFFNLNFFFFFLTLQQQQNEKRDFVFYSILVIVTKTTNLTIELNWLTECLRKVSFLISFMEIRVFRFRIALTFVQIGNWFLSKHFLIILNLRLIKTFLTNFQPLMVPLCT